MENSLVKKYFLISDGALKCLDYSLRVEVHASVDDIKRIVMVKNDEKFADFYDKVILDRDDKNRLLCKIDLPDGEWTKAGEYDVTLVFDTTDVSEEIATKLGIFTMYCYLIHMGEFEEATDLLIHTKKGEVRLKLDTFENFINDYVCEFVISAEIRNIDTFNSK